MGQKTLKTDFLQIRPGQDEFFFGDSHVYIHVPPDIKSSSGQIAFSGDLRKLQDTRQYGNTYQVIQTSVESKGEPKTNCGEQ